jgi:hypothetical protein
MTCVFALASIAVASKSVAQEFELRAADLRVVGDARWTGGGWGGYHPIRLELTNFGVGRDLEVRFSPHNRGEGVPTVRRRMRIEQNSTVRIALPVPLFVGRNSGRLEVLVGGEPVDGLREDLSLMTPALGETPHASLLVISPDEVNLAGFEIASFADAPASLINPAYGASGFAYSPGGAGSAGDSRHAVIEPSLLPTSWIAYTPVDLVAIRLDVLASLHPDERAALLDWVAAGGRLIIDRVGATPAESKSLQQVLEMQRPAGEQTEDWRPAIVADRQSQPILLPHVFSGRMPGGSFMPSEGSPLPEAMALLSGGVPQGLREVVRQFQQAAQGGQAPQVDPFAQPTWTVEKTPYYIRRIGFGRVAAVEGDVFHANGNDWAWLLRGLGGPAMLWPIRNGLISGDGTFEFLEFPIQGVQGIPVAAILTLITLFTLVIGPANYVWLWRRKQLSRLVVTVPAIALATSLVLFAYTAVAHGFGTKGRVRSVTLLDAGSNRATTISRLAMFSGRAPSRGLRFSKETAVYPLYPFEERFLDGDVDWTETQALTGGWLKSRTRTQFVTVSRRDERGRLTVQKASDGLRVLNGFEVPLRFLVVTDADGRAYGGENVAAGGEAVLHPLREDLWSGIRTVALEVIPELPEGVDPREMASLFSGRRWLWEHNEWQPTLRQGLLERHLALLLGESPSGTKAPEAIPDGLEIEAQAASAIDPAVRQDTLRPLREARSFLAVADANPGVDLGGLDVEERESLHVLIGSW